MACTCRQVHVLQHMTSFQRAWDSQKCRRGVGASLGRKDEFYGKAHLASYFFLLGIMYSSELFAAVILASIYALYCADFELNSFEFPWPEFEFTDTPAVGKVYIGLGPGNESEEFSVNENAGTGSVPVFLQLFNTSNRLPSVLYQGKVKLSCELTPNSPGYSRALFFPTELSPQGNQVVTSNVQYIITNAGRVADVRCWGVSTPDTQDARQFTKALSISQPVPFTIRKRGSVNICGSHILVSNSARTNTSTFVLELSEEVEDHEVTIRCSSTPAVPGSSSLLLVFPTFVMAVGESQTQVTYQRNETAGTGPVYVTCRGQSDIAGQRGQFSFNTSAGPPVLFVLDEGKVKIEPMTKLGSSRLELLLYLDAPVATSDVMFICRANVVNTTEEARDIAENPYCTAPVTAAPGQPVSNTTSDQVWRLGTENVVFQTGSIYRPLNLDRISEPLEPIQELIVVTCCAPASNNQDPKYRQQSAAVLINAQMAGLMNINWTDAQSIEVEQTESEILNPAYVEFGPCPCDLTEESCDINCCCDSFCSQDEKTTFECLMGPQGGSKGQDPDHLCLFEDFDTPDWHPFLCVHKNRSAFLGNFYYPVPKVETLADLLPLIEENTPPYDYRETAPRVPSEELLAGGYKQGFAVTTGLEQNSLGKEDLYTGTNYRLTLPRRGYNGACLQSAPVRYLQDMTSDCVHQVAEELCRADSVWSARVYVESSGQTDPSCPRSPQVLAVHASKTVTNTDVNYFCAEDLMGYVHSFETRSDVLTPNQPYSFAYEIPRGREDECQFDEVSGVYVCPLEPTFTNDPTSPVRCSWDDGFTAPPAPKYDNDTGICHNVVLDVHYNFTWQGSTILELNATMVLGDIVMTTTLTDIVELEYENRTIINGTEVVDIVTEMENITQVFPNRLTQKFGVNFYPLYVEPNITDFNITDNETEFFTTERYRRSGNPGYFFGEPVLSGIAVLNETDGSFQYMDVNDTYKFRLWEPGADGLCKNAGSKVVTFGDDEMTSCLLRLGFEDLLDCNYLRSLVLSQQDALMMGEYVSIVGDPNRSILSAEQWFQVLRENLTAVFPGTSENNTRTTVSNITAATTESLLTTTGSLATTAESLTTENSNETIVTDNITATPVTETPTTQDLDLSLDHQMQGRCINMPSAIRLDFLYAEAGQINYKPIWNIRGVRISYELTTWEMKCLFAESGGCHLGNTTSNSSNVQTFLVSSSVRFTQIPLEKPPLKTRYQLKHEEDDNTCKQDSCWPNLLYPFRTSFPGDSHAYTVAFACVALLHLIGLFCITRPWW